MPTEEINTREVQIGQLLNEIMDRRARGDAASIQKLFDEYPDLAEEVQSHLKLLGGTDEFVPVRLLGEEGTASLASDSIPGYEIVREIHRGGQGVVYEALQLSMKPPRTVALKVLLEGPFASPRHRWMFEREVKLVAALEHPNIVVIYDSGIAQGRYYFAMKYMSGKPLDTHVRMARLNARQIAALMKQICDAVACAHRKGVIHRDLKPLNILVGDDGQPCVLDFGMAKVLGGDLKVTQQPFASQLGDRMGTLQYMSPEQTMGDPEKIDTRTDIYSLGVILYELLTGQRVYDLPRDAAAAFSLIRDQDPPKPSRVCRKLNSDLDTIVMKALEKEPGRRYQSANELSEDLGAWLDGRPIAAKSASSLYVIRKLAVKHGYESLLLLALVMTIGSVLTLGYQALRRAQDAEIRQQESDRAAGDAMLDMNEFHRQAWEYMRATDLGWFFMAYRAGQDQRASELRQQATPDSRERAVMEFVLNPIAPDQAILERLGDEEAGLAQFTIGQRHLRAGRLDAARQAFQRASSRFRQEPSIAGAAAMELQILESADQPEKMQP